MSSLARCVCLALLAVCTILSAQPQKQVRQITIRSMWGGLGPHQDSTVFIQRDQAGYIRAGKPIDPRFVDALVSALQAPLIPKPDLANLGITQSWLNKEAGLQETRSYGQANATTPGQKALFEKSFTDIRLISRLVPELFQNWHTDDNPGARVEIVFDNGEKLTAYSSSQFAYMLPWCVGPDKKASYNVAISRAVSALLPDKTVNKDRLAEDDLAKELNEAVVSSIETEYNLRGAEDMAGQALAQLRQKYHVTSAEIDPWLRPEYGPQKYDKDAEEVNLHVSLVKASFPAKVSDAVTLEDVKGNVLGIDQFLSTASNYENLVLSVPWLKQYIREHPKVHFRITYVHDSSFGDEALRTFSGDMEKRERLDLIEKVLAQQKEIALVLVGTTYAESYWLIFPDKHMLLWRYAGPGGLLKWNPKDFGEGECADFGIVSGGCSGREVTADGNLIPEGRPRDVACVAKWRAKHPITGLPSDALFEVVEHNRSGLIDRAGAIIVPLCFDAIDDLSEGLARFERDGRWGFIDRAGSVVIQPTFPWAEQFHEGLAHVQVTGSALEMDGRWGYIDKSGKIAIPPNSARMMSDSEGEESAFHEGLAMTEVEGKAFPQRKGFIDKTGKLVIPGRFTYAYPFSDGLAAVTESESGDTGWGFIDKSGNWMIPPRFGWASSFRFGLAAVNRKQDCGYIDKTGAQVLRLPLPVGQEDCASAWGDFTDGLSRWLFGAKYGFIDRTGKTVIPPQFDLTFGFSEGLAAVQVGGKWGFVDTTGKTVIPPQDFSDVKPFHNGLSRVVVKNAGVGYIDRTGKFIWGPHKQSEDTSE
ncbi:MAG TPA: WG repeat-containing protein [Terracidiphilus sp.]|jgi:hypothetical protein|nr:WG repeat-containing protein [Terracidiphilus sp.]